ncbi:MAG: hypothetical protein NTZ90_05860 [Proteobacteria bacterium]|nr:hypothetical protein [Pseudomonadota bacterium]
MKKVLLRILFCGSLPVILFGAGAAPQSAEPLWRRDLSTAFGKAVCAGEIGDKPLAAWAAQAYDAQIEAHLVASRHGQPVATEDLAKRARGLASLRSLAGYSYGLCEGGQRGWIAVVPAPTALKLGQDQWTLPQADLERLCSSYRVDFASRHVDAVRGLKQLVTFGSTVSTKDLGDGTVSLTCQPRAPRWQGPVLWYLAPVGKGPETTPPDSDGVATATSTTALVPWLQRLRASQGLPPMAASEALNEAAANLAADGSLVHNRQLLQQATAAVKTKNIELLGEDRVRAHDIASMAWLLWNSPRHRQLLLNKDANIVGIASRAIDDDQLAVLVIGKGQAVNTSLRTPTNKAGAAVIK